MRDIEEMLILFRLEANNSKSFSYDSKERLMMAVAHYFVATYKIRLEIDDIIDFGLFHAYLRNLASSRVLSLCDSNSSNSLSLDCDMGRRFLLSPT